MALFNWAFAKSQGGEFLLRIEDTDIARSTSESEDAIFAALQWLGLNWDEGPDIGGPHGPYRQSERREIYTRHITQLLETGHAFHCFCSKHRLDELRAAQQARKETTRYDGHCLGLSPAEVKQRIEAGDPHVVRMRVPDSGACTFTDLLRGDIEIPYAQIDMQVLIKADGMPTYHFAVVVDDHLMQITHILRGEEWLNSVPKHQLLFEYFGWEMPVMVHLPLLRNPDQSKLSKRKNPTSVTYYRDEGFLPEALTNYLSLMGYSMPDEREIFSLAEFAEEFEVQRISTGGPVFDQDKLSWMNGQYLRALDAREFADRVSQWMLNQSRLEPLIELVQERVEKLSDLAPMVEYLLGARRPLTAEDFVHKTLNEQDIGRILHHTSLALDLVRDWRREKLLELCQNLAEQCGYKFRDFLFPLFIAISGRTVALPLFDSMVFLGADLTRVRVRSALSLQTISKKQRKVLDKSFADLNLDQTA